MTYLFFDLECANNFGGSGKICSFGYVLCNADFSIIKSEDLLVNPDAPFDWYLFKPGSRCRLAYRREDYQKHEKFPHIYSKVQSLLEANDRLVFGFGCQSDVATIMSECLRYDLKPIDFACHDIHGVLEQFYETKGSLGSFVEQLGIDMHGLEFHDSRADAFFTMKVTEKLAKDAQKPLAELLAPFTPLSSELQRRAKIKKLYKNYLERKEAAKPENGKPRRPPKKVTVPKDFDYRRELLFELEQQAKENR